MNHIITLPKWLDDLVFNEFEAVYHPCPKEVQYGPDQELDHIKIYLGTYFPRSYAECYCIVEYLLQNETYKKALEGLEEINIFDFCCGTGGELFGAIMAYQKYLPNLQRINIDACDANPWAIRMLTKFKLEHLPKIEDIHVSINLELKSIYVENEQYLQDLKNMLNRSYHLIMSFKALNEFVQGDTFGKENVYAKVTNIFSNKLEEIGVMLLLDVSNRNETLEVYYPEILNKGINDVVRNNGSFKTIIPHSCYFREGICASCYMQDIFYVSHSGHKNDVSKVAYRIICKKDFANLLMENYNASPPCRASHSCASKDIPYQDL